MDLPPNFTMSTSVDEACCATDQKQPCKTTPESEPIETCSSDTPPPPHTTDAPDSDRNQTPTEAGEAAAALTVQKVYRSYRTRRQLADTAIMNKDKNYVWWNVLEGTLLRQSSETFYAYKGKDTVASRWTRLKKKAAKVGKGLSKDENARKLAIQHWLEAIDPRHRYGHNLQFYYDVWEKSSTKEPFFYWLDIGDGRDVDLPECGRSKLQNQQIKYLGPKERKEYEVMVQDGKLHYKKSGELVHTPKGDKWIFVMSTSGRLYVAQKKKGSFQHSSFLAGGATKAAGRLLVNHGVLELMEAHSGHYHPTEKNFSSLVKVLEELGTDLSVAKVQTVSDDMLEKQPSSKMRDELCSEEHNGLQLEADQLEDNGIATLVSAVIDSSAMHTDSNCQQNGIHKSDDATNVVPESPLIK